MPRYNYHFKNEGQDKEGSVITKDFAEAVEKVAVEVDLDEGTAAHGVWLDESDDDDDSDLDDEEEEDEDDDDDTTALGGFDQ